MNPKSPETLAEECVRSIVIHGPETYEVVERVKKHNSKIIASTIRAALEQERGECEWVENTDGFFKTSCKCDFEISNHGGLADNGWNHCPHYSKKIKVKEDK